MKPMPAPIFCASTVATDVAAVIAPLLRSVVVSHSAVTEAVLVGNVVMGFLLIGVML
ncbi:unannotated protein [freshwater metagenome]|uniref:Unannotated protein n=1 Tax=freshwater metagenome TaxID=449393 RepID=A0A6J6JPR5_9ZZZZ